MTRHDSAMQAVTAKADKLSPEWSALAEQSLRRFLELSTLVQNEKVFLAEDFALYAQGWDELPQPHDSRAYGSVLRNAAKSGLIRRVGYKADRWGSPKSLWVAK